MLHFFCFIIVHLWIVKLYVLGANANFVNILYRLCLMCPSTYITFDKLCYWHFISLAHRIRSKRYYTLYSCCWLSSLYIFVRYGTIIGVYDQQQHNINTFNGSVSVPWWGLCCSSADNLLNSATRSACM